MHTIPKLLFFAVFSYLGVSTRAAQIIQVADSVTPSASNVTNDELPPDPYQLRVPNTKTSLIFSGFRNPVRIVNQAYLIDNCARAQFEIVQAVIAQRGDARISQPNFEWHHATLYLHINNRDLELTWQTLSETIAGIRSWGWNVAWIAAEFTILSDTYGGIVGSGSIELGYRGSANGTAVA